MKAYMPNKKPLLLEKRSYKDLIQILDGEKRFFRPGESYLDLITLYHDADCVKITAKDRGANFDCEFLTRINFFCVRYKSAAQEKLNYLIFSNDAGFLVVIII